MFTKNNGNSGPFTTHSSSIGPSIAYYSQVSEMTPKVWPALSDYLNRHLNWLNYILGLPTKVRKISKLASFVLQNLSLSKYT